MPTATGDREQQKHGLAAIVRDEKRCSALGAMVCNGVVGRGMKVSAPESGLLDMAGRVVARGIPCGETEKAEAGHSQGWRCRGATCGGGLLARTGTAGIRRRRKDRP
jgi:hypothetical protein